MKAKQNSSPNYEFFIKTDTSSYKGEWIAMSDKKIVSHGNDASEVYKQAKQKYPRKEISLAKVPEEQTLILKISQ